MQITREFSIIGLGTGIMNIELAAAELRLAYDEYHRECRLEDISSHLNEMEESELSGYTADEVAGSPELMGRILQSFMKHQSCELAENDVMEECIRTILAEQVKV